MIATTDNDIRRAAVDRFAVTDVRVNRYDARPFRTTGRKHVDSDVDDSGTWFMLFTKRTGDSGWEPIGRRRTRDELLTMVENHRRD